MRKLSLQLSFFTFNKGIYNSYALRAYSAYNLNESGSIHVATSCVASELTNV